MSDSNTTKHIESDPLDDSECLYHEAQADGVPYDEDLEPFTKDLPKLDISRT